MLDYDKREANGMKKGAIYEIRIEVRDTFGGFIASTTRAYAEGSRLDASKRLNDFMELTWFAWRNYPGYRITGEVLKTESVEHEEMIIGADKAVSL